MNKLIIGLVVLSLSLIGTFVYGEGNDEYTVLLLHNNGTDGSTNFIDDSFAGGHAVTAYGNAQIDTAQYKFGGASGLFDGAGDFLTVPDHDNWNFGSESFTIDFWVKFNDFNLPSLLFVEQYIDYNDVWDLYYYNVDNEIWFSASGGGATKITFTVSYTFSLDTWYHIALVRVNTDNDPSAWRLFINGLSQTLTLVDGAWNGTMPDIAAVLDIGWQNSGTGYYINGWLEEFRISKGIARWTSNFTPPTSEYDITPNDPPIADAGDDQVADGNAIVTLDGSASYDPDVGDTIINYRWVRLPDNLELYSGSNSTYDTTALGRAEEVIELTVLDNHTATSTDTMVILNSRINLLPPEMASIGDKRVYAGRTIQFQVEATDPEGFNLEYSANNLPSGATFNPATQIFSWRPTLAQLGTHTVVFGVDDGYFTDSEFVTIAVRRRKPILKSLIMDPHGG